MRRFSETVPANAVTAREGSGDASIYEPIRVIGRGSFGVVVLALVRDTGRIVAVKRVLADGRLNHRELSLLRDCLGPLQAMQQQQCQPPFSSSKRSSVRFGASGTCVSRSQGNNKKEDVHVTPPSTSCSTILSYHPNVVRLLDYFYAPGPNGERHLNLVMDYLPLDIHGLKNLYVRQRQERMPIILVKVIIFQVARALAFIHARGICHRDLKPSNLLIDPETGVVKLCDFGCAKTMQPLGGKGPREKNVSYICSRYYRAPELLLGSLYYHFHVDLWSLGCVLAELLCGKVLFKGSSTVDQMVEIFKVLGAPSRQEMFALNPQCAEELLPPAAAEPSASSTNNSNPNNSNNTSNPHSSHTNPHSGSGSGGSAYTRWFHALRARSLPWAAVLPPGAAASAVSLVGRLLQYTPEARLPAAAVLQHAFFDELFADAAALPGGAPLPVSLFQVTREESERLPAQLLVRMAAAEKNAAARSGGGGKNSRTGSGGADAGGTAAEDTTRAS